MTRFLVAALVALCASTAVATPREAAERFVDLWNLDGSRDGELGKVFQAAFIEKRGPERLQRILTMVADDNGDIAIKQTMLSSAEKIRFLAAGADNKWVEISLDLDAEFKVAGMSIARATAPASDRERNLSAAQIVEHLEAYLEDRVARGLFSGSVILAKNGKPLFAKAYGLADRASGRANTLDTPINLGSMNKMFTGLAITQLVAQGKLAYAQTVGHYLPDYPNQRVRDEVTLHQLLTHTSGMGMYWNDAYAQRKDRIRTLQDLLPTFVADPLATAPGAQFRYSNSGPVVLGLIIEAVSGMSYYDYVRKYIYGPAAMSHSDHYFKNEPDSGKATGYYVPEGGNEAIANHDVLGNIGSPAGGGYASANDLLRFAQALYDGRLIDDQHRQIMTSSKQQVSSTAGYAYLFGDSRINGRRYVGHNGGAPGINADFSIFPDHGYTLVVLSNVGRGASPVSNQLRRWIGYANE